MTIDVDRFDELVKSIRDSYDRQRLGGMAEEIASEQQEMAYDMLMLFSPRATDETFKTTGHKQQTSIEDGWRLDRPERLPDGARVAIRNISEHVDVQRTGTQKKDYPIWPRASSGGGGARLTGGRPFHYFGESGPRKYYPRLVFWLGAPLKWPVRRARFRKGGFFSFTMVRHPGFGPWGGKDFVEEAAETARPAMATELHVKGKRTVFRPLQEFFR